MPSFMTINHIPKCKRTADRHIALIWEVHNRPDDDIRAHSYYEFSGCESVDEFREFLIELIDDYWTLDNNREVACFCLGGLLYFASGGLSSGDNPTEAYETLWILGEAFWSELETFAVEDACNIEVKEIIKIRQCAQDQYGGAAHDYDIEIDPYAKVEKVDDNYWVEARVWVWAKD